MEDKLNFLSNGRQPLIILRIEDDLNLIQMENNLNIFENGRRPQDFCKDDLKENNATYNNWNLNNGCGTAPGNLVHRI